MAHVNIREDENLESAIKKFKKKVDTESILKEWKDKQYFIKPSVRKRLKKKEAIRKYKRKQMLSDASNESGR